MSNEHPTPPHQPPGRPGHPAQPGQYGHPAQPGHYGPPGPPGQPGAYNPYGQPPGQAPHPYGAQPPGPAQPATPYGAPAQPLTPYGAPAPAPYPPPGAQPPGRPGAAPYYGPYQPHPPLAMPGSVRGAQIVIFVATGLALLLSVLVGATAGAYSAGRFAGSYLPTLVLCVLAFQYPKAGNGVRVTSIVLASVQILFGLSATGQGMPLGILWLGAAIAVIVPLSQGSAGQWFRRHQANGVPPHHR
ncbi:hypothetical protein ACFV2D_23875 [Streptomyces capillispiralis]|uniref:hypothetical protein n=1 Tax=Streptomyces capillispiralis TaxID=68182 RepID=UPI0036C0BF90